MLSRVRGEGALRRRRWPCGCCGRESTCPSQPWQVHLHHVGAMLKCMAYKLAAARTIWFQGYSRVSVPGDSQVCCTVWLSVASRLCIILLCWLVRFSQLAHPAASCCHCCLSDGVQGLVPTVDCRCTWLCECARVCALSCVFGVCTAACSWIRACGWA